MKFKKLSAFLLVGVMTLSSAIFVNASTYTSLGNEANDITISGPSIDERISDRPGISLFADQYVVNSTSINQASWNTTWQQPSSMGYYKVNFANRANTVATIYVEDSKGNLLSKAVAANKEDALYVSGAIAGTQTVWIKNSNANLNINGTLTAKASTVSLLP